MGYELHLRHCPNHQTTSFLFLPAPRGAGATRRSSLDAAPLPGTSFESLQSTQPRTCRGKTRQQLLGLNLRSQGHPGTKPQEILGTGRTELPHGSHKMWFERGQHRGQGGIKGLISCSRSRAVGAEGQPSGSIPTTALARLETSGSHFLQPPTPTGHQAHPEEQRSPRGRGRAEEGEVSPGNLATAATS